MEMSRFLSLIGEYSNSWSYINNNQLGQEQNQQGFTYYKLHMQDIECFYLQSPIIFDYKLLRYKQMEEPINQPIILPLVLKVIKQFSDNHHNIKQKQFDFYFQAIIIETSPYLFITDGFTTIQAQHSKNTSVRTSQKHSKGLSNSSQQFVIGTHVPLKPDNQLRSSYYSVYSNAIHTFNCRDQQVEQPYQFPNPYGPYFHFQSRYQQFLVERRQIKWKKQYSRIGIFMWSIKLVNIANTGYYAPIIEISSQSIKGTERLQNINSFGLILYNKEIQFHMEKFRLEDLRKLYDQKLKQEANQKEKPKQISLCYYFKTSVRGNKTMNSLNPHVDIDEEMQICKYDKARNISFIAYSDLKGMCYSMKKLDKYLLGQGKMQTSAIDFEAAQKILKYRQNNAQDSQKSIDDLLQDLQLEQYECEQPAEQAQKQPLSKYSSDADEQSQSDSQDPLRKAYLRQLAMHDQGSVRK